jgi:hypothetical protein
MFKRKGSSGSVGGDNPGIVIGGNHNTVTVGPVAGGATACGGWEVAFNLGVTLGLRKSLSALTGTIGQASTEVIGRTAKQAVTLDARLRALMGQLGCGLDVKDQRFELELAGWISALPTEYGEIFRIGQLLTIYSQALLVVLVRIGKDGGLILSVGDGTRRAGPELMAEAQGLEDQLASLSVEHAGLPTRFFGDWLTFSGERTYEEWTRSWEGLLRTLQQQLR